MKSEPVFSVVSRSTSAGCSRSVALAAAPGGNALPVGFSASSALTFGAPATVAPPATTMPARNRRRCKAAGSDSAMDALPVFSAIQVRWLSLRKAQDYFIDWPEASDGTSGEDGH